MKAVSMILGHRKRCYHCGREVRTVYVPAVSDRWLLVEDFDGSPEQIELHDCPMHPSKRNDVAPAIPT